MIEKSRFPLNIGQRVERQRSPCAQHADKGAEEGKEDQTNTDNREQALIVGHDHVVSDQLRAYWQQ